MSFSPQQLSSVKAARHGGLGSFAKDQTLREDRVNPDAGAQPGHDGPDFDDGRSGTYEPSSWHSAKDPGDEGQGLTPPSHLDARNQMNNGTWIPQAPPDVYDVMARGLVNSNGPGFRDRFLSVMRAMNAPTVIKGVCAKLKLAWCNDPRQLDNRR